VSQLGGKSQHFMDTALIAYEVSKIVLMFDVDLIFCGHSKGGTHASLHSFITSRRAIAFNSPGVSPLTKENVVTKLRLDSSSLNDTKITSFETDLDIVTTLSELLFENREFLISGAERILRGVRFSPKNFGIVPPVGQRVQLTGSINPAAEVALNIVFAAMSKGSFSAKMKKFSLEKHSMECVLKCMNPCLMMNSE
jgi:hypothetical protein